MRKIQLLLPWLLCLFLSACINSSIESQRTAPASANLQPFQSLLVFVQSKTPDSAQYIEAVVAQDLRNAGIATQLGTAHLPHDAATSDVFRKSETLGVDGALIVAVELAGVHTDRDPAPFYAAPGVVLRPDSVSHLYGQYSARLFDIRVEGKHPKVWQAKVDSVAGRLMGLRTPADVTADAARQIVRELDRDDMIAGAEK